MYKYLTLFIISMVPLIELRGAIPYAQINTIPLIYAYPLAILGNMLPVPIIYWFARHVLFWGENADCLGSRINKVFAICNQKGEKAANKILQTANQRGIFIALMLFVAIPLPGTGAWTGTLAASLLHLPFQKAIPAILLGVIIAGLIMSIIGSGVLAFLRF